MRLNLSKQALFFAALFCSACEENPTVDAVETGSEDSETMNDLTCGEKLTMFREDGFCPSGMSLVFREGELDPVEPLEFEQIEFDGGRYQKGYDTEAGELFYMDESCMIACKRSQAVTQPVVCEAIDEEGNPGCTFASTLDFTLEACMDFVDACG